MEYTLDSVHLAKKALHNLFEDYRISSKEIILSGEEMIAMEEKEKRYFFGILTTADTRTAELSYKGNDVVIVDSGSQIAGQLFTAAIFKDLENNEASPEGLFLGHEINVLPH